MKTIILNNFEIGKDRLTIFAGPCAIESKDIVLKTAEQLKKDCEKLGINYVFKASYDKANRSSIKSFRGPGIDEGLKILEAVKKEFGLPIVTDIHKEEEAKPAAEVADVLQIPAFLCRQTDLLVAAAKTGKIVTVEEHSVIGGLGSAVCDVVAEKAPAKVLKIGMQDVFGESGSAIELIQKYGLDGESIYHKIKEFLQ